MKPNLIKLLAASALVFSNLSMANEVGPVEMTQLYLDAIVSGNTEAMAKVNELEKQRDELLATLNHELIKSSITANQTLFTLMTDMMLNDMDKGVSNATEDKKAQLKTLVSEFNQGTQIAYNNMQCKALDFKPGEPVGIGYPSAVVSVKCSVAMPNKIDFPKEDPNTKKIDIDKMIAYYTTMNEAAKNRVPQEFEFTSTIDQSLVNGIWAIPEVTTLALEIQGGFFKLM